MALFSITTSVSVPSLDGISASAPISTQAVTCQDYVEFTRDVIADPQIVYAGSWAFIAIINAGSVDMIAQVLVGTDYQTFVVPAGAHLLLPSTFVSLGALQLLGTELQVYTASGATRASFAIGITDTF